jgi:hypothetical protein
MNFVINVKPERQKVASADVTLRSKYNIGRVENADAVYVEFRYDQESRQNFVCLVYRLPEVDR